MYLDKLFKILEVVVKSGAGLTVSDINKITNIPCLLYTSDAADE